jgi:hypothetical protein
MDGGAVPNSIPVLTAVPPIPEATAKPVRPGQEGPLASLRSPSGGPPKARVYAVTTHCRLASETPVGLTSPWARASSP